MKTNVIYGILIAAIGFIAASCSEDIEPRASETADYAITATIEDLTPMSRMTDNGVTTTFQGGDKIYIKLSDGSEAYAYQYDATNKVFEPESGASYTTADLFGKFTDADDDTYVYAWFKRDATAFPADDSDFSVPNDQGETGDFLNTISMVACQKIEKSATKLNLVFHHILARLVLDVTVDDHSLSTTDIMNAEATIGKVYTQAKLVKTNENNYQLSLTDNKLGSQKITFRTTWNQAQPMKVQFECLLPPQTIGADQPINITFGNSKGYKCNLSKDIKLEAATKTTVATTIKADGSVSVFVPKVTVIGEDDFTITTSDFSGNRIFAYGTNKTDNQKHCRVYDILSDGSLSKGQTVYSDNTFKSKFTPSEGIYMISFCGDYAAASTTGAQTTCYFFKRDKASGNWYLADTKNDIDAYSVAITDQFLASGGLNKSLLSIWPIKEDGTLGEVQQIKVSSWKLAAYGEYLATIYHVYKYNETTEKFEEYFNFSGSRIGTDGKRLIVQADNEPIKIYDLDTQKEETWGANTKAPIGGVDIPVAIYEDYALVGKTIGTPKVHLGINICYRDPNEGTWRVLNGEYGFLEMMKKAKSNDDSIQELTSIGSNYVYMKGTNAIVAGKYFIENIDKMVEKFLENPEDYQNWQTNPYYKDANDNPLPYPGYSASSAIKN